MSAVQDGHNGVGLANDPALGLTSPPWFKKGRIAIPDVTAIEVTGYLF